MHALSLHQLPQDLLRQIMYHLDVLSLMQLSETCLMFHAEVTREPLWRTLSQRRFRVNNNTPSSRRLQAAGQVSWRTLYANWHTQHRMPISRHSGPAFRSFASARHPCCRIWTTVVSAEDCRLRSNTLRLRLIMQNVANEPLRVLYNKLCISLVDGGGLQIRRAKRGDMCATGVEWAVDRVKGHVNHSRYEVDVLQMYDFAILTLDVVLPDVVFEVDALERLKEIRVPCLIEAASHHTVVVATFVEKEIWDAYSLVPGGWWVRS